MYSERDIAEHLKAFDSVWKRVEESKRHKAPPTMKQAPQKKSCAVRFNSGGR